MKKRSLLHVYLKVTIISTLEARICSRSLQMATNKIVLGAVHKLRLQSFFCKHLYHRKCKRSGVGGQKKPNLVNVVCERPPREKVWTNKANPDVSYDTLAKNLVPKDVTRQCCFV